MSLNTLSSTVNWPLLFLTTLIIFLRFYLPILYSWISERFCSSSSKIGQLIKDLKQITEELENLSPQDQFAAYTRKERQKNGLIQSLKDERNNLESRHKANLVKIRFLMNILTVLAMIYLWITDHGHRSHPLFKFPFFHFPLVLWFFSLNTFLNTMSNIYQRSQITKQEKKMID